jgi:hypothetical protein
MDAAAMSRREALEVARGDEARPIQPRRFSIVLRKPLAARNDGGAPKSAFKSSKTMGGEANDAARAGVAKTPKGVTFMAPDAPDTPAARTVAVTHRRARMRTRKGTGRSVAARTFSLVLREPKAEAHEAAERDRRAKTAPAPDSDTSSDPSSAKLGSRDGASEVAGASGGESDSVAPARETDDADAATVEIEAGVVGQRGDLLASKPPALAEADGGVTQFDGYDDDGDFGGGFGDDFGDDFGADFGATPAHGGVGFGRMVDGGNDPMTGGLDGLGKRKRPVRLGPRRPAGTPHKLERARMAKRQSLALAGAGSRHDLEDENGKPVRRSNRTRTRPLQYWRGETKIYTRVHESLPTVAQMTHRTPNPAWPKHTPWHGGGAVIAVGAPVPADSAERARKAGEEARKRALQLADVAHLSDSEDDDVTEELARATEGAPLDPFGFSKK